MSKMQEAFESWKDHDGWEFADREACWKWMYEAGYQAAIADVKAGGVQARMSDTGRAYTEADGPNWLNMPIPLYKLEDK